MAVAHLLRQMEISIVLSADNGKGGSKGGKRQMSDYKCKKCGSTSFVMKPKHPHIGMYCAECDMWLKWCNKKERTALLVDDIDDDMPELKEPSPYDGDDLPWE